MRKNTEFNSKDLKWIREPKNYSITENKIEIVTEPILTYGKEPITIVGMIMRLFCKLIRMKNTFLL